MNEKIDWTKGQAESVALLLLSALVIVIAVGAGLWGCPKYNVWQQGLAGEAELARAEQNRRIKILEAKAAQESAEAFAQAEIVRARGAAEANRIIGDSLKSNEAYLRYRWIENLEKGGSNTIIYIPTEAGLPILEAARLKEGQTK